MSTYYFIIRFSWTADGIANIRAAAERRRTAIAVAATATYGIRVLNAQFVVDPQDDIEWSVAVDNVNSPGAAQTQITNLWNNVFLTFANPGPFVTAPRKVVQI
jgi:hypothetical protein